MLSTHYRRNTTVIREDYADNILTEASLRAGTRCVQHPKIHVPQEGEGRGGQENRAVCQLGGEQL